VRLIDGASPDGRATALVTWVYLEVLVRLDEDEDFVEIVDIRLRRNAARALTPLAGG